MLTESKKVLLFKETLYRDRQREKDIELSIKVKPYKHQVNAVKFVLEVFGYKESDIENE